MNEQYENLVQAQPETEGEAKEWLTDCLAELERVRQERVELKELQKQDEAKLLELAPDIYQSLSQTRAEITRFNRQEKTLAEHIRRISPNFPGVVEQTIGINLKGTRVYKYLVSYGIRLALIFCPEAVILDKKLFEKWLSNHIENPVVMQGIEVGKELKAYVDSDLSPHYNK